MIVFFPTYARRSPGEKGWQATVAGMVSRSLPLKSHRRRLAMAVLKRLLDLDQSQLDSDIFQRRAAAFLFQRVSGQRVRIAIGGRLFDAGYSDRLGHFQSHFVLDDEAVDSLAHSTGSACRWISYEAILDDDDPSEEGTACLFDVSREAAADNAQMSLPAIARGRIQIVEQQGRSVISDIDDTVKVTNVANRRELLANTLLREFKAVDGMADIYRRWQENGCAFHYVSASPWQLSPCLCTFLTASELPLGSMHLQLFRLKDSTPLRRLPSRKRSKRRTIEQIMHDFPERKFLLVGDSGERDPELYAAIARAHSKQVSGILIRQVEGKASREKIRSRLERLVRRLPAGVMQIFTDTCELVDR